MLAVPADLGLPPGRLPAPTGPGAIAADVAGVLAVCALALAAVFTVRLVAQLVRYSRERRAERRRGDDRLPDGSRITIFTSVRKLNRIYYPDRDPARPDEPTDAHADDEDAADWPRKWPDPRRR